MMKVPSLGLASREAVIVRATVARLPTTFTCECGLEIIMLSFIRLLSQALKSETI